MSEQNALMAALRLYQGLEWLCWITAIPMIAVAIWASWREYGRRVAVLTACEIAVLVLGALVFCDAGGLPGTLLGVDTAAYGGRDLLYALGASIGFVAALAMLWTVAILRLRRRIHVGP